VLANVPAVIERHLFAAHLRHVSLLSGHILPLCRCQRSAGYH
jgi:hypothetical protein